MEGGAVGDGFDSEFLNDQWKMLVMMKTEKNVPLICSDVPLMKKERKFLMIV